MNEEALQEQMNEEYREASPERLLSDEGMDKIREMSLQEIADLPEDMRSKYFSTVKYHGQRRMTLDSIEGIEVGGRSIDEILKSQEQGD